MSEPFTDQAIRNTRAAWIETDRQLGLEASLASARRQIAADARQISKLESEVARLKEAATSAPERKPRGSSWLRRISGSR